MGHSVKKGGQTSWLLPTDHKNGCLDNLCPRIKVQTKQVVKICWGIFLTASTFAFLLDSMLTRTVGPEQHGKNDGSYLTAAEELTGRLVWRASCYLHNWAVTTSLNKINNTRNHKTEDQDRCCDVCTSMLPVFKRNLNAMYL